jgi:hypothetical protein
MHPPAHIGSHHIIPPDVFSFQILLCLTREVGVARPKIRAEWYTDRRISDVLAATVHSAWDVRRIVHHEFLEHAITLPALLTMLVVATTHH